MARCGVYQHLRISETLSGSRAVQTRNELSLDAGDIRTRERLDREQQEAVSEDADGGKTLAGYEASLDPVRGCRTAIGIHRIADTGATRRRHVARRHRRHLSLALSFRRASTRTRATQYSLPSSI